MRKLKFPRSLRLYGVGVLGLFLLGSAHSQGLAQVEEESPPMEGVKVKGFVHNIAQDREVKKIGGQYQPEGLDIYLKRHIDRLYQQMENLKNDMATVRRDVREMHAILSNAKISAPTKTTSGSKP